MEPPLKPRLIQHESGLWEACAVLEAQELRFGFFSERVEAQRVLDLAAARHGRQVAEPENS